MSFSMFGPGATEGEDYISKLNIDKDLSKAAAKKSMEKGISSNVASTVTSMAADVADDALGGGAGGGAVSGALKAGASSGFNPYVMAAGAIMGGIQGAAEDKKARKMGEARGLSERAKGESKKADIYGQMAASIRGSLGGAQRKRSVNL